MCVLCVVCGACCVVPLCCACTQHCSGRWDTAAALPSEPRGETVSKDQVVRSDGKKSKSGEQLLKQGHGAAGLR